MNLLESCFRHFLGEQLKLLCLCTFLKIILNDHTVETFALFEFVSFFLGLLSH